MSGLRVARLASLAALAVALVAPAVAQAAGGGTSSSPARGGQAASAGWGDWCATTSLGLPATGRLERAAVLTGCRSHCLLKCDESWRSPVRAGYVASGTFRITITRAGHTTSFRGDRVAAQCGKVGVIRPGDRVRVLIPAGKAGFVATDERGSCPQAGLDR